VELRWIHTKILARCATIGAENVLFQFINAIYVQEITECKITPGAHAQREATKTQLETTQTVYLVTINV
jgi:hypothetical protein